MFISKFDLSHLHNEEHSGFLTYVDSYITEEGAAALKIDAQYSLFQRKLNIEKMVLDLVQKSSYTKRVDAADVFRDKVIRGFFKVVKGYLNHFEGRIADAAYRIDIINESFRDLPTRNREKQTQGEEAYLKALNNAAADVATLGLTSWINQIQVAHDSYVAVVADRNTETDAKPDISMRDSRLDTDAAYTAIVDRINAFITIDGDAGYATFVAKVNGRIDQFKTLIAQRRGRDKDPETDAKAAQ